MSNITPNTKFNSHKISGNDISTKGIQSDGNQKYMKGDALSNRRRFDELPSFIATRFNDLIDHLENENASRSIGLSVDGYEGSNVYDVFVDFALKVNNSIDNKVADSIANQTGLEQIVTNKVNEILGSGAVGVEKVNLSGYNSDNSLASFSELSSSDSLGTALEKLYTGIVNLNTGITPAYKATYFDNTGVSIADKFASIINGSTPFGTAINYTPDGGIGNKFASIITGNQKVNLAKTADNYSVNGNIASKFAEVDESINSKMSTIPYATVDSVGGIRAGLDGTTLSIYLS